MASRKTTVPDWARKIQQLRRNLQLSQTAFGARLSYSAMAVSRWESGAQEPPAQCYIQLGNLAGEPDCWTFWSRAGLKSSDLSRLLPEGRLSQKERPAIEVVLAGTGERQLESSKKLTLVGIPVLPLHAATLNEIGDQQANLDQIPADEMIAAPFTWFPNPAQTTCLRVKGNSLAPSVCDGDIIAVDYSETDPGGLSTKLVVAWHRERGLCLSRFLFVQGVQMLDSEHRDPIVLGKDRSWRIIGKVLWIIHRSA